MAYGLQLLTPPGGEPLSLAEAKLYARVDSDNTAEDGLFVGTLIPAARKYVESWLGFSLVSQKWRVTFDRFPSLWWIGSWGNTYQDYQGYQGPSQGAGQGNWQWTLDGKTIRIPKPPLQQVTNFGYIDTSGVGQNLAATTVSASIGAGQQTVTPASMAGITAGCTLLIDDGAAQENLTVTSTSATTFTATFAVAHTGPVNVRGFQIVTTKTPGLVSPIYGITWPIARAQYEAVAIDYVCGFGPVTTVAAQTASGTQTVTPASMLGIYSGTRLVIDPGLTTQETVVVSSVTSTTFTATFAATHAAGAAVAPALPESIKQALQLLVNHYYTERKPVLVGASGEDMKRSVESLLYSEWSGEVV